MRVHRRDVAVHGIEALEHDQLRPLRIGGLEQFFEMAEIVMPPDLLLAAGLAHALDHRIVVERVRQDQAVRQQLGDGRDAGLVRDIAGGEHQRGRLAVQVGELALELDQRMVGAGDIAGAAGAGAHAGGDVDHGADHLGVLGHAEIIVGAPDHDLARPVPANARGRAESGRRCVRGRQTRDNGARPAIGPGRTQKRRCNPCVFSFPPQRHPFFRRLPGGLSRRRIVTMHRQRRIDRSQSRPAGRIEWH